MRGAKKLDGKRVRILRDATTKGGAIFKRGDQGTFTQCGVVRCRFTTDDGRSLEVGHWQPLDFEVLRADEIPARVLTDEQIATELNALEKRWNEFRDALNEDGGHGGSPGEWMVERMGELEHEQNRRKTERKIA